ncbi:myopalladin isoform X2 [Gadus morhua]|uniref:myopalladin isoform X2 n=1 Tax=Gadus morhua TaxID=8049 RepID=UPI0011B579F0|nr:myopalladin-like isoform X2 [Gadus morhua]
MSHSKPPGGAPATDPARPARGPPGFGVENQSKKEFLNKAADFIEELSSLFKANSTKRVRPQGSGRKTHKSWSQKDPEDRDRPVEAPGPPEEAAVESRRPSPGAAPYPPEREAVQPLPPQQDGPAGGAQQTHGDPPSQQVEVEEEEEEGGQREEEEEQEQPEGEAGRAAPTDPPYSEEPVCEPPCFVQKLKSREVLEGSKVQLDCTVTGLPVPEVRWFCEGKELENSPDIQILTLAGRHSLIIAEAFEEDTGRYSCFASNYYGTDSTSAEIYVEGASSTDSEGEPFVEHVPHQVQKAQTHPATPAPLAARPAADIGADDSDASSQTTIVSTPTSTAAAASTPTSTAAAAASTAEEDQPYQHPPVGTLREESPVQPEAPPPASECSSTTATPFLYEEPSEAPVAPLPCAPVPPTAEPQEEPVPEPLLGAGPQPLGLVEVNPAEAYGQGAPSQTLTVENQNSTQLSHQEQDVRPIMAAPVFTKSLQEVSALEGQLVVLECRMKGVPSPRVEWYREGTVIEDSPDFRILQKKPRSHSESEEICTLVIAEVFPEDSGMFTCTASNKYGTVSSLGRLRVKGNVRSGGGTSTLSGAAMESGQVRESFLPDVSAAVQHHPEVTVTASVKPCSSSVRLEPLNSSSNRIDSLSSSSIRLEPLSCSTLRLDPLSCSTLRLDPLSCSTLRLDPLSCSTLRLDPLSCSMSGSVSLPSLDPQALGGSSRERISYTSTPRLDPQYLTPQHLNPPGSGESAPEPLGVDHGAPFYLKPFAPPSEPEPPPYRPAPAAPEGPPPKVRAPPAVVPLPDPPANSCLKSSAPTNPREPRPSAKAGLRVTFRLPEDEDEEEPCDPSGWPYEEGLTARGPPPLLTKPKLDPAQLQILHNQVLLEQQQDGDSHSHSKARPQSPPWTQSQPPSHSQYQPPPQALSQSQPQIYSQYQPPPQAQSLTQSQPLPQSQSQYQPAPYTQSFTQCQPPAQSQVQTQSQPQISSESVVWSPRLPREPTPQHFQLYTNTAVTTKSQVPVSAYTMAHTAVTTQSQVPVSAYTMAHTGVTTQSQVPLSAYTMAHTGVTTQSQVPVSAYTMAHTGVTTQSQVPVSAYTMAPTMPTLTSGPAATLPTAPAAQPYTVPAPATSRPSPPQLKMAPPARPQLSTPTSLYDSPAAAATPTNTIHASHLNLSLAALSKSTPPSHFSSPPPPQFHATPSDTTQGSLSSSLQEVTSPTPMLRSSYASLMNLGPAAQSFTYSRPQEFVAARLLSPVMSPSPTESPVPLLNELAAEFNSSSAASSPTLPPFSPPPPAPRVFPTRVLRSPASPLSVTSSPTLISAPYLNSVFAGRTQSPPQAASPASSSSTPSPIQNPVAFLSSVLPSLHIAKGTNSMGLPKSAPAGQLRRLPKSRTPSSEDIRASKEVILNDIERRLNANRFNDNSSPFGFQQAYKVSNFEQRLMSEIEFRLERTPVEESDDEVHHDAVPTGRCIAPVFDKKLKNFRAMEGVPVTLSCKLVGIPIPKVYWFKDGKQILQKNVHYKKIREGDGTCALHIDCTTNDDDGNYTVMAANPQGRISCSGHLIVQTGASRNRMTPIHSQRVKTRIQEVEDGEPSQERFFQPHFLQAPGDMVAHEGRLCRLDCKVSGLPNPELMWLVNGKPIYPDIFHRMLVRENGVHSLVIDPVVQNHAGVYTCIASNKAGQSSFCLDLKVLEKEVKHPPHFVEKLQNCGIPEGNPARLECRVSGMPPPALFWKKDNDTIPRNKDRFSMHQDATGYVCLLVQPTRKEDAGWYTVSAKNEAGIVSCTSRLDIYAQWHQSIPTPMKTAPRTGSRYAALTGQGLDIKSAFPSTESGPILFSSSPRESQLESDEL